MCCVLLACVPPGTAWVRPKPKTWWVLSAFIAHLLSKVLLPAPAPPSSPGLVSVACALVPLAPSGLLPAAPDASSPSPEV